MFFFRGGFVVTELPYRCPQCGSSFHFGDGYPDLYGMKVCSAACHRAWLVRFRYTSTLLDELPAQMSVLGVQQQGDGGNFRREIHPGDPGIPEDPHRQME